MLLQQIPFFVVYFKALLKPLYAILIKVLIFCNKFRKNYCTLWKMVSIINNFYITYSMLQQIAFFYSIIQGTVKHMLLKILSFCYKFHKKYCILWKILLINNNFYIN